MLSNGAKITKVVNIDNLLRAILLTFRLMNKRKKEDDIFLKKLGQRIKVIRKEKGIKQVDLGYACDLDKSNMNRIEAGNTNPSVLLLKKLSEELGVPLYELLHLQDI